tara:strand:- start:219 stop:587 length:369 start_codon:yes stop_codon:yes gene_type:complete
MKDTIHKPGIHENYLVSRHLELEGLDKGSIDALVEKLNELPEVDDASITMSGGSVVLNISYDASTRQKPLDDIQQVLTSMGAEIADGWWNRFKQRYYATTDQNVYDNARYEPSCCNKAPPGK